MHRVTPICCALAVLLSACGASDRAPGGTWAGSIDTLGSGTVVVHNPASGVWDSESVWRIEEELRIGTTEGTGPDLFGEIAALEVDAYGRIYVLERQASEIRVFDPSGAHLRTVGRAGSGPGELKQPTGFAFAPDGHLWVVDPNNARYAVFDTAGAYLATHHRPIGGYYLPWPGMVDGEGRLFDLAFTSGGRVFIRYDAAMAPVDTIPLPSYDTPAFEIRDERRMMSVGIPFTPYISRSLDPRGYLWSGLTDHYRIAQQRIAGDTVRIIERAAAPVPVTAAERDEAIENLKWFTEQGGKVDPSKIPSTKPAFGAITVDDQGYLWVRPATTSADKDRLFDLFDPEGRYLGAVRSPVAIGYSMLVRGDRLYAVVHDELEVPYVIRARIVGRTAE